jgi:hypothetical protein
LLDLEHAQIALREIVGKRHRKIIQESQHLLGAFEQGIQEIFRIALFWPTLFLGWGESKLMVGGKALLEQFKILDDQAISLGSGNRFGPSGTPLLGSLEHAQQQIVHGLRPGLLVVLSHPQAIS